MTGGSPGGNAIVQYKLTNNLSCSQTLTYNVLILSTPNAVISGPTSVCSNSSVLLSASPSGSSNTWSVSNTGRGTITSKGLLTGGASPNANAIVNYKYIDSNGCTSATASYNVYVYPQPKSGTVTATGCGSYTWNGTTYTTSGTYTYHSYNFNGCDSTTTLNLTIKANSSSTTKASICPGDSYLFNGTAYSIAGSYAAHLINSVGCDSTANLILTYKPTSSSTTKASICSGDSYLFNGTAYNTAGTHPVHFTNSYGCDSTANLVLTIKPISTSTTYASICNGSSYTFNGTTYTSAGTYVFHSLNSVGCDSAATLILTINQPTTATINVTACSSYTWHGATYTASGIYTFDSLNAVGCDSLTTLKLTIIQPTTATINVTACSNYSWHGTNYTGSGSYTFDSLNTVGCDSLTTLNLTITQPTTATVNITSCSNYTWHGVTYTLSGGYTFDSLNAVGCDSLTTLNLTIIQPSSATISATACGSYGWHGTTYTASGNYTFDSLNAVGCDSLTTLNLTINQPTAATISATVCGSYTWHGTNYTASGLYTFDTLNAVGCDSLTTLNLTIIPNVTPSVYAGITTGSQVICDGGSLTIAATPTNGGSSPTYIWYIGGKVIGGQTTSSYTYSPIAGNRDTVTVKLIGADNVCQTADNALSNIVTPYITPYITPTVSIVAAQTGTICSGKSVTFSATPIKFGSSPSYQWFNGTTVLTGVTTLSYYSYTPAVGNTDAINVVVTGANNVCQTTSTAHSNSITPIITQSFTPSVSIVASQTAAICGGSLITFSATPTNGGSAPAYQWYKGNTPIGGANTANYSYIPLVGNNDSINVKLTANNTCQPISVVNSRSITPVVIAPVTPTVSIVSSQTGTLCSGKTVTFNATPSKFGTAPAYQWFNGSTAVTTASTKSYYTYAPTVGNTDKISVVVTGANNTCQTASSAQSNSITPVISAPATSAVSIVANPSSSAITGTTVAFTIGSLTGIATPKYQWYKGSTAVSGATSNAYSYVPANKDVISLKISGLDSTCQVASAATSNSITMKVGATLATISENRVASESTGLQANLYPNPSHGSASLKLAGVTNNVTITVRGIYGNTVATLKASKDGEVKLPTQSLASGLYIVSINDGITRKDIKWAVSK